MKAATLLLTLGLLPGLAQAQTTWYVDAGATPPGNGSPSAPYVSIQHAIDQSSTQDGHTLIVLPGSYPEDLVVTKELAIRSASGPLVTFLLGTGTATQVVMESTEAGIVLDGFSLLTAPGGLGVYCGHEWWPHRVENCILVGQGGTGVLMHCEGRTSHCTIVGYDVAVNTTGGGCAFLRVEQTVMWANGQGVLIQGLNLGQLVQCVGQLSNTPTEEYGCVAGDPQLWDIPGGDYHPRPGSPCISVDAGALSYDPTYAPPPTTYCTGKLTSQGCVPAISSQGQASATSPSPCLISCDLAVDQKFGMLVYGLTQAAQPFQGGTLCLGGLRRTPSQSSGGSGPCTGHWDFDMNARIQSGVDPSLVPGVFVYSQWWGRDAFDPTGFGSQLSNALRLGIAP